MSNSRRVAYFYDSAIPTFHLAAGHPMKPIRSGMTHNLILNYGLYRKMEIYRPHYATDDEMSRFHSDDYLNFLRLITPENMFEYSRQLHRFNVGEDCPVFDGLYELCQLAAGGSIAGAMKLNHGQADIAINWAGGLHHAKKSEAAGFCYVNDIVLGILELLKVHERVVYIDCDIHHGDGVEEAFYTTDRVMTVSFHKFGEYFPGTGDLRDIGAQEGRNYALNFPLKDGMDDASYEMIFKPIMAAVMERFQPGAVVLQLGADSLAGDRLGCFNLTIDGHAECVRYMKSFNVPLLVLGGGGYTIRNVARCWAYETSVLLDEPIDDELPFNDFFEYYGPDFRLHIDPSNMPNLNSREELEKSTAYLLQVLHQVEPAPSAQMLDVPPETYLGELDEDAEDPDIRISQATYDKIRTHPSEFYDDAVFGDGGRAKHRDDPAAAAQGVLQNELQPECPPTNVPAASS